jgi:hypothetical protein
MRAAYERCICSDLAVKELKQRVNDRSRHPDERGE